MDDNKELVEKIARAIYRSNPQYRYDTEETARFLEYEESDLNADIALRQAQAALSIILPELDKYRSALTATNEYLETLSGFAQLAVQDLQKGIEANETALKTTTGHTEGGG